MRVCWLRHKDRKERWWEELVLCKTELASCQRYFRHMKAMWETRREAAETEGKKGHMCYTEKQISVWEQLETRAIAAIDETTKKLAYEKISL